MRHTHSRYVCVQFFSKRHTYFLLCMRVFVLQYVCVWYVCCAYATHAFPRRDHLYYCRLFVLILCVYIYNIHIQIHLHNIYHLCVRGVCVYRRGGIHLRMCLRGVMCFDDAQGSLSLSTHIHTYTLTHTHTHTHTYTLTCVCARDYVLFWRSGLPSDYFEGTLEKFDPAKPDKEGQVTHPPLPMSRPPPPLWLLGGFAGKVRSS